MKGWGNDVIISLLLLVIGAQFLRQNSVTDDNSAVAPAAIQSENFKIIPKAGKTFGADVYGFSVVQALKDPRMIATLHYALEEHLVLVLHNVSHEVPPQMHLDFARYFGPINPSLSGPPKYIYSNQFRSPDAVKRALANGADPNNLQSSMIKAHDSANPIPREITKVVKEPNDLLAFGEGWHSDLTFNKGTPSFAILVGRELPPVGQGNTFYSDMRYAYEKMPEDLRARIADRFSNHSDGAGSSALHPCVRHDNKFQKESLFVNKAFSVEIIGEEPETLTRVLDYVDNMPRDMPEATLSVSWQPGQIVMWDNRYTQHSANADYKVRREMHRIIVQGTIPF